MATEQKIVFKMKDVPYLQSPDKTMRDQVMITEDSCGAQQYTAGFFWMKPGTVGGTDYHPGKEEIFYVFEGRGKLFIDDVPYDVETGDVAFIPDGARHYMTNEYEERLGLFWAVAAKWSDLPAIQEALGKWDVIELGSPWE